MTPTNPPTDDPAIEPLAVVTQLRLKSTPVVGGLLAALAVLLVVWQLDRGALSVYQGEVRADTERELAAVRGAAEIAINRRIHLLRGVKVYVSINPNMTEREFADLSANIMQEVDGIRSVTSIKDNVINDVYPRAGNEDAIGMELLKHPDQRAAAEHAIKTGQPWLAGPIHLVQGGEAFIHRAPVFETLPGGPPGGGKYWGMVSIVIDKQPLISTILASTPDGIEIAIRARDSRGELSAMFLGDPSIEAASPIETTISLPTGTWQLYGVPKGGWPVTAPGATQRHIVGLLFAFLVGSLLCLVLQTSARYRESTRRLGIANEHARAAQKLSEQASRQSLEKAKMLRRYASQLEEAQAESLRMMADIEAARHELSVSNEVIKSSNRELEEFAYVASHDLQEPLRKVSSFCQLLQQEYGDKIDGDGTLYMTYIVEGATRMRSLIQDLLLFSRIQLQGSEPDDVDSGKALESALYNLQGAIEGTGAVVTYDEMPTVRAYDRQLAQLLQNLIGNGIKYCVQSTPKIHVGVKENGGDWIFSVSDNGIGIAPQYHEKVFGIFKRLHGHGEYSGTGIGLAICKRIVDRLKGRIWIESQEGRGATFSFSILKA